MCTGRSDIAPEALPLSGVAYWLRSSAAAGISREVAIAQLRSVNTETLCAYQRSWKWFSLWCAEQEIGYGEITVNVVCKYLLHLFHHKTPSGKDYSSGALNRIRSSISFFVQYVIPGLGNMMPVVRLFNYFYKTRPNLPCYQVTWDVGVVLRFLAQWHPKETHDNSLSSQVLQVR